MCGIAGYIGKRELEHGRVNAALDSMDKRGPDFRDSYHSKTDAGEVYLLHNRLGIIDLDPRSNQPFSFEECHLVFNGEIYNYLEIKSELSALGWRFQTNSDTEVLIKSYYQWGDSCVKHFEGMWSFALYDSRINKLLLSRDRFAEKPLYIYRTEYGLFFGSEIKTIQALADVQLEPNINQAFRYLVNGHKSLFKSGEQFYSGLEELDIASNGWVDTDLELKQSKYWEPKFDPKPMSTAEAVESIQKALVRSVELRMRADVPLAFCLSGGVDSSAMASIAAKKLKQDIQTFSIIDSDPRYNELENIQATIRDLGCKHHLIELNPEFDYLDRLEKLVDYHDAPIATISYLVHSRLIEAMSERGFKVSISGTGADELFTGYYDHFLLQLHGLNAADRQDRISYWRDHAANTVRNPYLKNPNLFIDQPDFRDHIYLNNDKFSSYLLSDFNEGFTEVNYSNDLLRNRMMNELFHEVVRVILKEDDLNSMYYSIENRSPFLDSNLFSVANSIPSELLIQKGYNKYLLRESMKGILNDTVRLSREKKGFNASVHSIIDSKNARHRSYILDGGAIYDYVDKKKIEALMKENELPNSYKKFFFSFLNLKIWLDGFH